jgi:hypothetical protein
MKAPSTAAPITTAAAGKVCRSGLGRRGFDPCSEGASISGAPHLECGPELPLGLGSRAVQGHWRGPSRGLTWRAYLFWEIGTRRPLDQGVRQIEHRAMGFKRRKMEDQRRQAAEKEAAARRASDAQVLLLSPCVEFCGLGPSESVRHQHSQKPERNRTRESERNSSECKQPVHSRHSFFSRSCFFPKARTKERRR